MIKIKVGGDLSWIPSRLDIEEGDESFQVEIRLINISEMRFQGTPVSEPVVHVSPVVKDRIDIGRHVEGAILGSTRVDNQDLDSESSHAGRARFESEYGDNSSDSVSSNFLNDERVGPTDRFSPQIAEVEQGHVGLGVLVEKVFDSSYSHNTFQNSNEEHVETDDTLEMGALNYKLKDFESFPPPPDKSIQNLKLNFEFDGQVGTGYFPAHNLLPLLDAPVGPEGASSDRGKVQEGPDFNLEVGSCQHKKWDTSVDAVLQKTLSVGLELGMTFNCGNQKILEMLHKGYNRDKLELERSKKFPVETLPDLSAEDEYPLTPLAERSTETPGAVFENKSDVEWWEDSQLREDFQLEDEVFPTIPPGFESENPPAPGFETTKFRRKALRISFYNNG